MGTVIEIVKCIWLLGFVICMMGLGYITITAIGAAFGE